MDIIKHSNKERLLRALSFKKIDRPPVIIPGGMMAGTLYALLKDHNLDYPAIHTDKDAMVGYTRLLKRVCEIDNFGVPFCMTVEAEDFGAGVDLGTPYKEPVITDYIASGFDDLISIKPVPCQRHKVTLQAIKALAGSDIPVLGNITGPTSLLTSLMEPTQFYRGMAREEDRVQEAFKIVGNHLINFALEQIDSGIDVLVIADPGASGDIIGSRHFMRFVAPPLTRIINAAKDKGIPVILHICGNILPLAESLEKLPWDALSVDSIVNLRKLQKFFPGRAMMGNVSTHILAVSNENKAYRVAKKALEISAILAPACGLSTTTLPQNIRAMVRAAKAVKNNLICEVEKITQKMTLSIFPEGRRLAAVKGENLLDFLLKSGIAIESACGHQGICGKCAVKILHNAPPPGESDRLIFSELAIDAGMRLACRASISGHMDVEVKSTHGGVLITENIDFQNVAPASDSQLAVAIDIGTTTVKAEIITVPGGKTIVHASTFNPQRYFGHDVISRIHSAENSENFYRMKDMIRKSIKDMINRMLTMKDLSHERVCRMVVSGNTVMLHLFFGMDVTGMGKYPYSPVSLDAVEGYAPDFGFNELGFVPIIGLPMISGYLGGDITAGLLFTGLNEKEETTLFIDIGTNSEIILSHKEGMAGTSCAAGPALEGMNIQCGMSAAPGAVEGVKISDRLELKIIPGYSSPRGLCGSGIIELMSELIRVGLLNKSGKMLSSNENLPLEINHRLRDHDGVHAFDLSRDVFFTQKDARQVQLAKGAILSGFRALIQCSGIVPQDIKKVIIAGEFGRNLKAEHIIRLGLMDDLPGVVYEFIGNSSLEGAKMIAVDPSLLKKAETLAGSITQFPLSAFGGYEKLFLESLEFPHASPANDNA